MRGYVVRTFIKVADKVVDENNCEILSLLT